MAIEKNDAQPSPGVPSGAEDYEYLLDDYTHFAPPAEGEVLQGKVHGFPRNYCRVIIWQGTIV